jgi:tripartite-type tricarboxylate transporter receptor subunit TctC
MKRRHAALQMALWASAAGGAGASEAAAVPKAQALRFITAAPAGGGVDAALRRVVDDAAARLGARAQVDNRPGASGLIAARSLARAAADGTQFGLLSQSLLTLQALGGPLNLSRDFKPLCRIANVPCVLVVAADAPWATLAELSAAIRATRTEFSFGSGGIGSAGHLALALLAEAAGWRLLHVPFKSLADALWAVRRGDLALAAGPLPGALAALRSGGLRALAVTTRRRAPGLVDVPTAEEAGGLPGYAYDSWSGIFAPAAVPTAAAQRVAAALAAAAMAPDAQAWIADSGIQLGSSNTLTSFADDVRADLAQAERLVKRLGLKATTT